MLKAQALLHVEAQPLPLAMHSWQARSKPDANRLQKFEAAGCSCMQHPCSSPQVSSASPGAWRLGAREPQRDKRQQRTQERGRRFMQPPDPLARTWFSLDARAPPAAPGEHARRAAAPRPPARSGRSASARALPPHSLLLGGRRASALRHRLGARPHHLLQARGLRGLEHLRSHGRA